MLRTEISFKLGYSTAGSIELSIVNASTQDGGQIEYLIVASDASAIGTLPGYWAWGESLYACLARVIHNAGDWLHRHFSSDPVEELDIAIYGISPFEESVEAELSKITLRRYSKVLPGEAIVRASVDGKVTRGTWPLRLDESCASLPWQIIYLCSICDHRIQVDFALPPTPPAFIGPHTATEMNEFFLEDLPFEVEVWARAYLTAFAPASLKRDGKIIELETWNTLVFPKREVTDEPTSQC